MELPEFPSNCRFLPFAFPFVIVWLVTVESVTVESVTPVELSVTPVDSATPVESVAPVESVTLRLVAVGSVAVGSVAVGLVAVVAVTVVAVRSVKSFELPISGSSTRPPLTKPFVAAVSAVAEAEPDLKQTSDSQSQIKIEN